MAERKFDMGDYVDVASRLTELREKHPEASLQPLDHAVPYRVEVIGNETFVVYAAACYRTPDDLRPGVGVAWEPFPGKTPYTRNSELQNAETSAWGRAIVAALAADTKRGVATAEDVRNRREEPVKGPEETTTKAGNARRGPRVLEGWENIEEQREAHATFETAAGESSEEVREAVKAWRKAQDFPYPMTREQLNAATSELERLLTEPF